MTITPAEARELLDGATPGPWHAICEKVNSGEPIPVGIVSECADTDDRGYPIGNIHVFDQGAGQAEDNVLAAAAPDLAQTVIDQAATIAGMTEEWGVAHDGNVICLDFYGTEAEEPGHQRWTESRTRAEKWAAYMRGVFPGETYHIARRTVGPVEVIDGE